MSRKRIKPKRVTDFPKVFRDAYAHHKAFCMLGFDSSDIWFGFGEVSGDPDVVFWQLKTQGKVFTVVVGKHTGTRERVFKEWQRFAELVQTSSPEELDACWKGHLLGSSTEYFTFFAAAIVQKGIIVPELASDFAVGSA